MKILVINGPNINMLGIREPGIYGSDSFETLCNNVKTHAEKAGIEVKLFQSNHEGALVDEIQAAYGIFDGIVINPGAYTHTSIALLDALKAVSIPTVEVHISDVSSREDFRQIKRNGIRQGGGAALKKRFSQIFNLRRAVIRQRYRKRCVFRGY